MGRITIFEKNQSFTETTSVNIVPSLTPDEILSVVPRGAALAEHSAGTRSVVFDGFPTLGLAYRADGVEIDNAIVTTHLGSGGVSFAPAVVAVSHRAKDQQEKDDALVGHVLNYSKSNRSAE